MPNITIDEDSIRVQNLIPIQALSINKNELSISFSVGYSEDTENQFQNITGCSYDTSLRKARIKFSLERENRHKLGDLLKLIEQLGFKLPEFVINDIMTPIFYPHKEVNMSNSLEINVIVADRTDLLIILTSQGRDINSELADKLSSIQNWSYTKANKHTKSFDMFQVHADGENIKEFLSVLSREGFGIPADVIEKILMKMHVLNAPEAYYTPQFL